MGCVRKAFERWFILFFLALMPFKGTIRVTLLHNLGDIRPLFDLLNPSLHFYIAPSCPLLSNLEGPPSFNGQRTLAPFLHRPLLERPRPLLGKLDGTSQLIFVSERRPLKR